MPFPADFPSLSQALSGRENGLKGMGKTSKNRKILNPNPVGLLGEWIFA